MFDTSEMPSTRIPTCRAAMTSSHTLIATVSAPHERNMRISAGVSKLGPSAPRYTPSRTRTPRSAATSWAMARSSGSNASSMEKKRSDKFAGSGAAMGLRPVKLI